MILVIAEKPSVAQTIAAALGVKNKKDGYLEGGGYLISWCVGHLVQLSEAAAYGEQYRKWSYESLPILPDKWQYTVSKDKEKQFNILKELMHRADVSEVVNACDAGREGELIFRFVYEVAGCKKPIRRLWISSMEDGAIRSGFENLKDGREYDALFASALCRAKADWIIGIIKEQYSLTSENISENTAVLSLLGASSNESVNELYPLAIACFAIILIAGIFMISSCMNSNVAQRTKFFGMMRCIGASKQQIVRFVRLEALNWCKTAIPIGCALGTVTCWVSCLILKFIVKGEWVDMPLFSVSISGILCGAAIGIITVFIAAQSPAKQAAKVSPIAAISGNTETSKKIVHAANTRLFKVETSLGVHHATGTKKNLILMTGSFALTIMLFLTFSACLDIVHKLLPSVSDFTPDITISSQDESNSIDKSISEEISEISGVESVFGMMYRVEYPAEINGNTTTVDLFSYGDSMMDSFKKSVVSGNLSKVYGNSQYVMAIHSDSTGLDVGDKIKIGTEELEVACVMSEGVGSVSGSAVIVCSEETYTRLIGEQGYAMLGVVLEKDVSDTAVNKIYELSEGNIIADSREENDEVNGSYWVFRIAAYSFLAIISLITILNIMNSVSMGVSARIKQYGAITLKRRKRKAAPVKSL